MNNLINGMKQQLSSRISDWKLKFYYAPTLILKFISLAILGNQKKVVTLTLQCLTNF